VSAAACPITNSNGQRRDDRPISALMAQFNPLWRQPLFYAAKKLFGSYVNAVAQAGIDYWEMSQAQLKREREARERAAANEMKRGRRE